MSKTVEQIYQKKTQHEHILARPDTYIGTIEPVTDDVWVYDEAENIMKQRKSTWIPGLYKIFDEILVNAADNKVRDPTGQTTIKVTIDERSVRVYNNGEGIPIQRHREHNLWIPEMIFGHLLTSSNYDDDEAKVTGGRNGYGAKLTNVFSSKFELETVHSRSRKKFYMQWSGNMLQHAEPVIVPCDGPDYTMVTFYPDFSKFHTDCFSEDMLLMMKRRVYDIAGCTDKSLKCYLNKELIPITTFPQYVELYPTMGEEAHRHSYARVNDRWELCVRVSNAGFQQVSFVNSIATTRGGTHVKYILDQITTKVVEQAKKRSKTEVKPYMIRPHIFLFINCLIENPGFDSQTKETLTTVKSKFGSTCEIPQTMIDYILKSDIVNRSVEMANSKLTKEMISKMKTSDRRTISGIPKLDDANEAGGKNSHRCTLILTEGDSAKTLCTAGLAVKDRDYFGVFPLRGKVLNVRDASLKKIGQCEEIQKVMKIMGLDIRQKYHSVEGLRYGHLMIMSDQDTDGSHIKGLIINFIHFFWPELLKVPGFLQQFITPIVKARRKGRATRTASGGEDESRTLSFFSMPNYFEWKTSIGEGISNYEIRYYKGLGTSGPAEGREYFTNIDRHRLEFVERGEEDTKRIVMAFAKDKVEERKEWITAFKTNTNVNEMMDYSIPRVSYGEFVDKELILFSIADCERSIPSVVDGFKPGQRKILFGCFKRKLSAAIKVMQLAGYVSEHAAYHHGDISLIQTIIGMAQDYVGSNNVPLLRQDGQFGTRLQGGKDSAAGRYIFTRLMNVARTIFHPADDYIVEYKDDDGLSVEPYYYVPIIPMALVNGTAGIGTGFSTNIPCYNPIEIIDNLERLLRGEDVRAMMPWYFGFRGTIEEKEKGKFLSHGKYEVRPDGVVSITELPIGMWTQTYKKFIEDLRDREIVVQYREHNTDVTVDFELFLHPQVLEQWVEQGVVEEKLQLREFIHATNIIAFDREGQITKYRDAESLLKEFYLIRLEYYDKRKQYLLGELRRACDKIANMARFVQEVVDGTLVVTKRKKKELLEELRARQYTAYPPQVKKKVSATTIQQETETEAANAGAGDDDDLMEALGGADAGGVGAAAAEESADVQRASRDYDYLLGMKLWNLTEEMIARLNAQLKKAQEDLATLEGRSPRDLWLADLAVLRPMLVDYFADREKVTRSVERAKLEKKKPFDVRRLKVPILSDKARQALAKEMGKKTTAAARRGGDGAAAGGGGGGDDDDMDGARPKPPPKKRAPRKKKKKDSDDDDISLDAFEDDSDGDDSDDGDSDIVGLGDNEEVLQNARKRSRSSATAAAAGAKKPRAKRATKATDAPGTKRVKTEAKAVSGADDLFDLEGFGLDALTTATPSSTAVKKEPLATRATAVDVDDDDLIFGGSGSASAKPAAASAPAVKAKPKPKAAAKPRAVKKETPTKKKKKSASSSSDDDDSDSSSDASDSESDSASSSSSSSSDDDSDESFDFSE